MAPAPVSSPRRNALPHRPTLADALLGRNLPARRASNEVNDRAAIAADLRRERSKANRQSIDLGKPLGPYDTNSVRDRVRQWQAQGGGVIERHDAPECPPETTPLVSDASTDNDAYCTPKRAGKQAKADEVELGETANRSRKAKARESGTAKDKTDEKASPSTPKRRVTSDGHWVKKKKSSPPKNTPGSGSEKAKDKSGKTPDDGIRVTPISDGTAGRRRPKPRDAERPTKSYMDDDGIRVHDTPSKRSGPLKPKRSVEGMRRSSGSRDDEDRSDEDRPSSWTTPSPPRRKKTDSRKEKACEMSGGLAPNDSPKGRRSSRHSPGTPEKSPRSSDAADSPAKRKSKPSAPKILREVYDEGRKIFSKSDPAPAPPVQGNRIEAWLSDTPDPFVDGPLPVQEQPILEQPMPAKSFQQGLEEIASHFSAGRHEPSERVDGRISSKNRRRGRSFTNPSPDSTPAISKSASAGQATPMQDAIRSDPVEVLDHAPDLSPGGLKRAGAMRSPTSPVRAGRKSSPRKVSKFEDVPSSADKKESAPLDGAPHSAEDSPRAVPPMIFKRPFPSTGRHQLSTIASVESFNTRAEANAPPTVSEVSEDTLPANDSREHHPTHETQDSAPSNAEHSSSNKTGLKRRLTTHADLMSVLSLPKAGNKSIRSARSIRTNRSKLATATIPDLMKELATDEGKYMRELNTLVDGVIPVLLTCVLSKSDAAIAAGLFNPRATEKTDPEVTRPIVDMGIALERLKSLHKRIPLEDPQQVLRWAQGAHKVYQEYLKAWRLGFQDVVVNLAPATAGDAPPDSSGAEDESLLQGLPRNAEGDVINSDGERVDVAFLLKRPLVRIKYLTKTIKGINFIKPSVLAEEQSTKYQDLVSAARQRTNDERARLEDEGAANIDPTRARDPRTLAPMTDVVIDRSRRVRARDYFGLDLQHSSGQRVDCKVELLLRDDAAGPALGGDLLICEVDATSRWLLFPPIAIEQVSARNGDFVGEIVIMMRGSGRNGKEWQELLSLDTDDEQTGFEWVQMLGLTPVPPSITRQASFASRKEQSKSESLPASPTVPTPSSLPGKLRTPSPREVEVPIGEPAPGTSQAAEATTPKRKGSERVKPHESTHEERAVSPVSLSSRTYSKAEKDVSISPPSRKTSPSRKPSAPVDSGMEPGTPPRDLNEAMLQAGGSSSGLKRTKAKRYSRHAEDSSPKSRSNFLASLFGTETRSSSARPSAPQIPDEQLPRARRDLHSTPGSEAAEKMYSFPERLESVSPQSPQEASQGEPGDTPPATEARPRVHHRTSSVPTMELPSVPKLRKAMPTNASPRALAQGQGPEPPLHGADLEQDEGRRTPNVLKKPPPRPKDVQGPELEEQASPPTPPHRTLNLSGTKTPKLSSPTSGGKSASRRRSSSPLKHQYEPSSASDSFVSEDSVTEKEDDLSFSESSEDEELEDGDAPTPLLPLGALRNISKVSPKGSIYSLPNGTLTPSQSASQAPYNAVPQQPTKASRTIASIFSWSEKGSWDIMHPDECSIVITPGLIEAYEMTAEHSRPLTSGSNSSPTPSSPLDGGGEQPLVGLELTPLVPLRRGTALDISIRSRPTPQSKITSGNNIMFRSRNPEECEMLYSMINFARINNPTYIALQNARGPYGTDFGLGVDRRASARGNAWWGWGNRKNSYRAPGRGASSLATSESSIGSMTSTFSALRRFGMGGRSFNIAKSSISSRGESRSASVYSSSSNSSVHKGGADTPPDPFKGSPIGLTDAKIRLYQRETVSKWRDMGSARLSITRLPSEFGRQGPKSNEKRILIKGKTAGEPLLDVCLGESAFERVARTGIALSILEEVVGPNGEVGQVGAIGGVASTTRVYMIQMKSEAETAYTYSLVGKLKY